MFAYIVFVLTTVLFLNCFAKPLTPTLADICDTPSKKMLPELQRSLCEAGFPQTRERRDASGPKRLEYVLNMNSDEIVYNGVGGRVYTFDDVDKEIRRPLRCIGSVAMMALCY